jgi:putative oligomerization/nucleic acid binding protein
MAMTPDEIIEAKSRLFGGLDGVLEPGERIFVIVNGAYQQAVVGTDRRVFVYKAGNKTGSMWRRKLASWTYAEVADIELQAGVKSGVLTVHPHVMDPAIARYGAAGHGSPQQSPNAITFAAKPGSMVVHRVEALRERVAAAHGAPQPASAEAPAADSTDEIADEIRKLGRLRDDGLLTEEEFQAKKAELLERF